MTYRAPLMKHLGGDLALRVFKRAVSRNLPAKLSETKKITCSKHEKASINNKATTYGVEERMEKVEKHLDRNQEGFFLLLMYQRIFVR